MHDLPDLVVGEVRVVRRGEGDGDFVVAFGFVVLLLIALLLLVVAIRGVVGGGGGAPLPLLQRRGLLEQAPREEGVQRRGVFFGGRGFGALWGRGVLGDEGVVDVGICRDGVGVVRRVFWFRGAECTRHRGECGGVQEEEVDEAHGFFGRGCSHGGRS